MSDGSDETEEPDTPADEETAVDVTPETVAERLDEVGTALETAETEADLDEVEATLDTVETQIEATSFPEPDDEDEEPPAERLSARVEELHEQLAEQRGPYGSDVVETVEAGSDTLTDTRWTEDGEPDVIGSTETLVSSVSDTLDVTIEYSSDFPDDYTAALDSVVEAITETDLDADDDADTIAALLEAAETFTDALEDAEEWDDLTVVEQLTVEGFYDRLDSENRKDFPPELGVIRIAEQENDPERILTAFETFDSEFMQENCVDAFRRMGASEAYDAMEGLAQRRDRPAIEVLGKIGDDRACEMLHDYITDESNPPLQKTVLKTLGEIGSPESTQPVANRLVAEDYEVRSQAARALGRIGDARAVGPLGDVLAEEERDSVRAAAAWALVQIGTEAALEEAAEYVDDRSFIVQAEAEKASDHLGTVASA
ncbi:MAG: HEAT repeat domain-containing protein [Halobacteriales archaeon]|nr:HEAT repeat domain-containing protein [Halobacteriales archaeon]